MIQWAGGWRNSETREGNCGLQFEFEAHNKIDSETDRQTDLGAVGRFVAVVQPFIVIPSRAGVSGLYRMKRSPKGGEKTESVLLLCL